MNVAAGVQTLARIHHNNILVTEAPNAELDARFVLTPMPAEFVKGIAEPVATYAVREGPSASAPSTGGERQMTARGSAAAIQAVLYRSGSGSA